MNVEGSNFLILPSSNNHQSDVILLSQFATCNGDEYEAYGYYKEQPHLKKYFFVGKKKNITFYGRILKEDDGTFHAYNIHSGDDIPNGQIFKYKLSISDKPGEIKLNPYWDE